MKNFATKMMFCTLLCIFTASGLVNAQNFTLLGAASPTATLTSSDPNDTICVGGIVSFTAAAGGTNYQFFVNGVSMQSGAGNVYIPSPGFTAGNQQVVLLVDNGTCQARDTINFVTMALPVPTLSVSPGATICAGSTAVFTAGGGTSYNFKVNGISVQNGASTTYTTTTLTNGQSVTVDVTNAAGCLATSTGITMTVNPLPTPTLAASANPVCAGTSVTFTAGGGVNYNFKINGTSVQNSALNTYATTTLTTGQIVTVDVTNGSGCIATSTGINMTVNPIPHATTVTGNAVAECVGNMTNVTITGLTGSPNWTFEIWNTSGGLPSALYYSVPGNSAVPNTVITVPIPLVGLSNMFLRVTDGNGCSNH